MNQTRFPKEDHLPEWALRNNRVTKGDRVDNFLQTLPFALSIIIIIIIINNTFLPPLPLLVPRQKVSSGCGKPHCRFEAPLCLCTHSNIISAFRVHGHKCQLLAFDFRQFSTSDCERNTEFSTFFMKHVVVILNFGTLVGIWKLCKKEANYCTVLSLQLETNVVL